MNGGITLHTIVLLVHGDCEKSFAITSLRQAGLIVFYKNSRIVWMPPFV